MSWKPGRWMNLQMCFLPRHWEGCHTSASTRGPWLPPPQPKQRSPATLLQVSYHLCLDFLRYCWGRLHPPQVRSSGWMESTTPDDFRHEPMNLKMHFFTLSYGFQLTAKTAEQIFVPSWYPCVFLSVCQTGTSPPTAPPLHLTEGKQL